MYKEADESHQSAQASSSAAYAAPGTDGAVMTYEKRYDNYIGGRWVPPVKGEYFENPSPVDGKTFTSVARGTAEDIELALDAAHAAAPARRPAQAPPCPSGPARRPARS